MANGVTADSSLRGGRPRLAGKVALITGAGTGIGRACALLFAEEGARVVVAELDAASGEDTAQAVREAGGDALFMPTDVTESDSVEAAVRGCVQHYGRLDVLCNNAGGSSSRDGPVTSVDLDEFWRAIKLNLLGTWLGCRFGIPEIVKAGGGAVVNMSS
ncbi:MAG: cpnA 2, partial [Rhizobacter sp.]|nr:cpnA 2 [Rhizobacter sp.]